MSCELKEVNPTDVAKKVEELLQCPICHSVPLPPIWNCMNGHIVCGECRPKIKNCGVCRCVIPRVRNLFMEEIVGEVGLTCPYEEKGCTEVVKGKMIMEHKQNCKFGPKFKWIQMNKATNNELLPSNAVQGGFQMGVKLFVMRARHRGSIIPGKLYERTPMGCNVFLPRASVGWGFGECVKEIYEILVASPDALAWIPSQDGQMIQNAVPGGYSEDKEPLYIGRFLFEGELINGQIHPSRGCCYIGVNGMQKSSSTYEILVEATETANANTENHDKNDNPTPKTQGPGLNGTGISSVPVDG